MTVASEAPSPPDSRLLPPDVSALLLRRYSISHVQQRVAGTPGEAVAAATELGFPVAVKAYGRSLGHKTELGAVRLGLTSGEQVERVAENMLDRIADVEGFVVQPIVQGAVELIVGGRRDPTFGPVVVVGMGGTFAEVLRDTSVRLAPVSAETAREMILALRGAPLLNGFRGGPPVDLAVLEAMVVGASTLMANESRVLELDLNPVIASGGGALAVDARIVWSDVDRSAVTKGRRSVAHEVLRRLVEPKSIVVVGASRDTRKQGGRLLAHLQKFGFDGELLVVNPSAPEVQGVKSFSSVDELPSVPELACIVTPAEAVPDTITACARRGIPCAIVYTAGFREAGSTGEAAQQRLEDAVASGTIRVCGPNTAGVVNAVAGTYATFAMGFETGPLPGFETGPLPGSVSYLTQSGALGSSLISRAHAVGVGFSKWISVGNELDLSLGNYLDYLVEDPETRVVLVFMEALRDPEAFRVACAKARARRKPVVVLKAGRSDAGRRAALSHTAAIVGEPSIYDAALDAMGVLRVDDLQTLLDVGMTLEWQPLPRGSRVGVVAASGGACSLLADACVAAGLQMPQLPPAVRTQVEEVIPPFGAAENPVDVTAEVMSRPDTIGLVSGILLECDQIDALIVMLTTNADPPAIRVAEGVVNAAQVTQKPVVVARVGAESLAPIALSRYQAARIPVFSMPDRAVGALATSWRYARLCGAAQEDRT